MSVGKGGRVVGSACVEKFLAALSYSLTGMGRGREKTIKYRNCSFRIVGFFSLLPETVSSFSTATG